ncbi:beige/beach-related [Anaeramoeba flamelloides]|uniref:Beige/beach-related n=1 Tax=Anaeramoeba flamelloides TaxID=1746091 RepID=A0AAV7ZMC1_9EUKA|nr:beige/beach-related [Anaeramoeba flamelloides]
MSFDTSTDYPRSQYPIFPNLQTGFQGVDSKLDELCSKLKVLTDPEARINWYYQFSKRFLEVYQDWDPTNAEHSNLEEAISSNNAHNPEIFYEILYLIRYFSLLVLQRVNSDPLDFSSSLNKNNFTQENKNSKLPNFSIFNCIDVLKIFLRSNYNFHTLMENDFISILTELCRIISLLYKQILDQFIDSKLIFNEKAPESENENENENQNKKEKEKENEKEEEKEEAKESESESEKEKEKESKIENKIEKEIEKEKQTQNVEEKKNWNKLLFFEKIHDLILCEKTIKKIYEILSLVYEYSKKMNFNTIIENETNQNQNRNQEENQNQNENETMNKNYLNLVCHNRITFILIQVIISLQNFSKYFLLTDFQYELQLNILKILLLFYPNLNNKKHNILKSIIPLIRKPYQPKLILLDIFPNIKNLEIENFNSNLWYFTNCQNNWMINKPMFLEIVNFLQKEFKIDKQNTLKLEFEIKLQMLNLIMIAIENNIEIEIELSPLINCGKIVDFLSWSFLKFSKNIEYYMNKIKIESKIEQKKIINVFNKNKSKDKRKGKGKGKGKGKDKDKGKGKGKGNKANEKKKIANKEKEEKKNTIKNKKRKNKKNKKKRKKKKINKKKKENENQKKEEEIKINFKKEIPLTCYYYKLNKEKIKKPRIIYTNITKKIEDFDHENSNEIEKLFNVFEKLCFISEQNIKNNNFNKNSNHLFLKNQILFVFIYLFFERYRSNKKENELTRNKLKKEPILQLFILKSFIDYTDENNVDLLIKISFIKILFSSFFINHSNNYFTKIRKILYYYLMYFSSINQISNQEIINEIFLNLKPIQVLNNSEYYNESINLIINIVMNNLKITQTSFLKLDGIEIIMESIMNFQNIQIKKIANQTNQYFLNDSFINLFILLDFVLESKIIIQKYINNEKFVTFFFNLLLKRKNRKFILYHLMNFIKINENDFQSSFKLFSKFTSFLINIFQLIQFNHNIKLNLIYLNFNNNNLNTSDRNEQNKINNIGQNKLNDINKTGNDNKNHNGDKNYNNHHKKNNENINNNENMNKIYLNQDNNKNNILQINSKTNTKQKNKLIKINFKYKNYNSKIELIIELLGKIKHTVSTLPNSQIKFIKNGIYDSLKTLLSYPPASLELITNILSILSILFKSNSKNIWQFSEIFGFKKFSKTITNIYKKELTKDSQNTEKNKRLLKNHFQLFLNLLVETEPFNIKTNYILQHSELIPMVFIYAFDSSKYIFNLLLDTFLQITRKSIHNISCCCISGLIFELAKLIPKIEISNNDINDGIIENKNIDQILTNKDHKIKNDQTNKSDQKIIKDQQIKDDQSNITNKKYKIKIHKNQVQNKNKNANDNKLLLNKMLLLMTILGSHSLTVKELKVIINLLTSLPGNYRPPYQLPLLKSIRNMMNSTNLTFNIDNYKFQNPKIFFEFDGQLSSLQINQLNNWPSKKGYTFTSWIRIISLTHPKQKPFYLPRLFCFLNEKNYGFEAFLQSNNSYFEINHQKNIQNGDYNDINLNNNSNNNNNNGDEDHYDDVLEELKGFENEKEKEKEKENENEKKMDLKNFDDFDNINLLNLNDKNNKKENFFLILRVIKNKLVKKEIKIELNLPFKTWFFLSIAQSPHNNKKKNSKNVKIIINNEEMEVDTSNFDYPSTDFPYMKNKIGSNFQNSSGVDVFWGQMSNINFFDNFLTNKQIHGLFQLGPNYNGIFDRSEFEKNSPLRGIGDHLSLSYSAKATQNKIAINQSPFNYEEKNGNRDASLISMFKFVSNEFSKIIQCLGGIKIFFPLIIQLDQPIGTKKNMELNILDLQIDKQLSYQIIEIITELLLNSIENQKEMIQINGFSIISYLFQEINHKHLNLQILERVFGTIMKLKDHQEKLCYNFINDFLLNFNIWIYCDLEIQYLIFKYLSETSYLNYFRVKKILKILKDYYWIIPNNNYSKGIGEKTHIVTKKQIKRKKYDIHELKSLRLQFFHIIETLLKSKNSCLIIIINNKNDDSFNIIVNGSNTKFERELNHNKERLNEGNKERKKKEFKEKEKDFEKEKEEKLKKKKKNKINFYLLLEYLLEKNKIIRKEIFYYLLINGIQKNAFKNKLYPPIKIIFLKKNQLLEKINQFMKKLIQLFYIFLNKIILFNFLIKKKQFNQFNNIFNQINKLNFIHPLNIKFQILFPLPKLLLSNIDFQKKFNFNNFKNLLQIFEWLIYLNNYQKLKDIKLLYQNNNNNNNNNNNSNNSSDNNINIINNNNNINNNNINNNNNNVIENIDIDQIDIIINEENQILIIYFLKQLQLKINIKNNKNISELIDKQLIKILQEYYHFIYRKIKILPNVYDLNDSNFWNKFYHISFIRIENFILLLEERISLIHFKIYKNHNNIINEKEIENNQEIQLQLENGKMETNHEREKENYYYDELKIYNKLNEINIKQIKSKLFKLNIQKIENQKELSINKLNKTKENEIKYYNQSKRNWRYILRSLTNERGAWNENKNLKIFWKLDNHENSKRQRLRLKRNYNFNNHKMASLLRDSGSIKRAEQILKDIKKMEKKLKTELLKKNASSGVNLFLEKENELLRNNILKQITSQQLNNDIEFQNKKKLLESDLDQIIFETQVDLIKPFKISHGILKINNNSIQFFGTFKNPNNINQENDDNFNENNNIQNDDDDEKDKKKNISRDRIWQLDEIIEIHKRRFRLRRSAIEIFLKNKKIIFLNFKKTQRNRVFTTILNLKPKKLKEYSDQDNPLKYFKNSKLIKLWKKKEISNFEYLMKLNKISGRTYNDLSQYPIFPWVIKDYTSKELDLNDPQIYRDFSKPVGMWNPDHQKELDNKFLEFVENPDMGIIPFHYGSHYSNIGTVLYYLIRIEPFTTYAIELQGGKFDHSDRMFHSVPQTYQNCYNSLSDVKELIPEFFYFPEFLENANKLDLGKRQTGEILNNVELPPWANGSVEEFIRINRQALESEHVSEHLHEWVDLIFGYKQKGIEAERARNVFYYLTYEDKVDIDKIDNPIQRKSIEDQIENFGQTPMQLFTKPHPKRNKMENFNRLHYNYLINVEHFTKKFLPSYFNHGNQILFLKICFFKFEVFGLNSKLFAFDQTRTMKVYNYNFVEIKSKKYKLSVENEEQTISKKIGLPFAEDISHLRNCFAISPDGSIFFSCGYWDSSFRMTYTSTHSLIAKNQKHKDIVTCLSLDNGSLVTGSRDTTAIIWSLVPNGKRNFFYNFKQILFGHDDEITCLDLNVDLNIVVTGSKDQTLILHTLEKGIIIRSIQLRETPKIIKIIKTGYFLVYSSTKKLRLYSINGKLLITRRLRENIKDWAITKDDNHLITAGENGMLGIWYLYHLKILKKFDFSCGIVSLALSSTNENIAIALENGKVAISRFL